MRRVDGRRVPVRTRAAEKASMGEQAMVLVMGAVALLAFLLT